ncbi:MAG: hypothetical protein ABI612_10890 [Betaproteobacteria bacterium]
MHRLRQKHRLITAVLTFALVACGRDSAPRPPPAPPKPQPVAIAGVDAYRQGLAAVQAQDHEGAVLLLRQATRNNHELAEAWYEKGRIQIQHAVPAFKTNELLALEEFREGLQAEQEALRLLNEGKVSVWSEEEQAKAREVMDLDLRGAEEALGDQEALTQALRLRIY